MGVARTLLALDLFCYILECGLISKVLLYSFYWLVFGMWSDSSQVPIGFLLVGHWITSDKFFGMQSNLKITFYLIYAG